MNRALPDRFSPALPPPARTGSVVDRLALALGPGAISRMRLAFLVTAIWTAVGVFQTVPEVLHKGFEWPVFLSKVTDGWAWVLLTPALLLIDRRLNSIGQSSFRVALILLLSIPASLIHTLLAGLLVYPIEQIWWNPLRSAEFAKFYFLGSWVTYCALVGIWHAFKFYNRLLMSRLELERMERRLVEANLNALRLQLEPHFLFNALNAISSEVVSDPKLAREMIENLGTLLRHSLDCKDSAEITLERELTLLGNYIAIQKVRFGGRIDIEIDVAPEVRSALVPSMLLQPLVENAIRHGVESRMAGGRIEISAKRRDDQLEIDVVDNGAGLPPDWRIGMSSGIGLRVTQERLEALYPESGADRFTVGGRKGDGTKVAIRLPLRSTREART
ncbi:sensor histidine kinase [Sphingomonas sp. MS122]|uniref:sensor histidine kinase n=1 Tax=Sphingomonas sp. MS122 TaxID=3412683 RepID=UPI003C2EB3A3